MKLTPEERVRLIAVGALIVVGFSIALMQIPIPVRIYVGILLAFVAYVMMPQEGK